MDAASLKRCSRCEADNPASARFCADCGTRLSTSCPGCGRVAEGSGRFCTECGVPLTDASPSSPGAVLETQRPYTPRHLAEKVLTSRSALEGERKQVTVLFVDVVESTRLAERLDPEAMHRLMDGVLRLMADSIHRYEGTVNQFLGDGLMALFGAPLALEDHALRAVEAALAIRETVGGYSEMLRREQGVEVRLRMGLNSGPVVVGRIGDDLRMDYTAVGDTTHLAARMQELAEPGTILMSEATQRLVAGHVWSESRGLRHMKARGDPVPVFAVTGRRRHRTRLEVGADHGLTPLVGRERELGVLRDCFARARAGRGQVVGVMGEAGVGKSRLLHEFRRRLESERVGWFEGHCVPYGQTTPYLPVIEILKASFLVDEGDNALQIDEKLRQGARLLGVEPARVVPFLRELCGAPDPDDMLRHLDPKDKRQRTFEALLTVTVAASRRRPQVFVFEDIHWMDRTSEEYLAFLVDRLAATATIVLTTFRPGYSVPWAHRSFYTHLPVDVLSDPEVEAMVAGVLGVPDAPADLVRVVGAKAEGNPLFVEEIVRALRDRRLTPTGRAGIDGTGLPAFEVPGTVENIIRARLDRLGDSLKRTLQAAAVVGRRFSVSVLTRIADAPDEIPHHLEALKRLEVVHEIRLFPEAEYGFTHGLVQEVAYHTLLGPRRRELHGAIAAAIEDQGGTQAEEVAPILAYHFERSGHPERGISHALLAGDRAARLYAHAEATTYYDAALAAARSLPDSPATRRAIIDATLRLAAVGATRQDIMERDRQNLEAARALAEELGDEARLASVLYWLGRDAYVRWQPALAIAYARQSLDIADRLDDLALAAPPVNLMGRVYWQQSSYQQARELLERSVEQMRRLGNKSEEATAAGFAGFTLAMMGDFDRALAYTDSGLRLAQEIQNPYAEAVLYLERAIARGERGEWAPALADFASAEQVAERVGDLFRLYVVKFFQGRIRTLAGDPGRARVLIEESLAVSRRIGATFALAWQKCFLARALLALGEREAVSGLCEDALRLAEEVGDRFPLAIAHATLAEALAATAAVPPDTAETHLLEAIRIHGEIGTRPELARSYVAYTGLLRALGRPAEAGEFLARAITMFHEMGMSRDLEQAAGALRAP